MSENKKNLYYLDDLSGYKVDSAYSDVRGWEVKDADGRTIGVVDRLLANKESQQVVYLDIEVDHSVIEDGHQVYNKPASEGAHEFVNKEGDTHLIIPIGLVSLDEEHEKVLSNEIDYSTFAKTKRHSKATQPDRHYELVVFAQYFPDRAIDAEQQQQDEDGFYDQEAFKRQDGI